MEIEIVGRQVSCLEAKLVQHVIKRQVSQIFVVLLSTRRLPACATYPETPVTTIYYSPLSKLPFN